MKLLANGKLTAKFDAECMATREILDRVGDTWSVLAIAVLGRGPMRFNALKRSIDGISQRMMTATLRGLERDGMVSRTVIPTNPPSVEYALTALGTSLLDPVIVLATWAQAHRGEVQRARKIYDGRVLP